MSFWLQRRGEGLLEGEAYQTNCGTVYELRLVLSNPDEKMNINHCSLRV